MKDSPYSRPPWHLVECLETGLVYLANPPDYAQLDEDFAWEKTKPAELLRRTREEPVVSRISAGMKKVRRACFRVFRRVPRIQREAIPFLLAKRHQSPTVLDVGCGSARKLRSLAEYARQQHGLELVPLGIEISGELAREAMANLADFGGSAIHAPAVEGLERMTPSSVDVILLSSYLEHEIQPLKALRLCREALKTGGVIIIKVPNFASFNRRVRQGRWCGFRYPDHVNYFTPRSLRLLVGKAGLEVARMNFLDRIPTSDNMWLMARKRASE